MASFKKRHPPKKNNMSKLERSMTENRHQLEHRRLLEEFEHDESCASSMTTTPTGSVAIYVGEEAERFLVPTGFLSHPLFRMLLDKAYDEFGFEQRKGLTVPCSVATFLEVLNAVECCRGRFEFGKQLVEELV